MNQNETKKTNCVTGKCRISYVNVWEPRKDDNGNEKYSVMILVPKDDVETLNAINACIKDAYDLGADVLKGNAKVVPSFGSIHLPLRDGDEERPGDPVYEGMFFFNATSKYMPDVWSTEKDPFTGGLIRIDEGSEDLYSGCYCRCSINCYAYNTKGGKGIAVSIRALQKVEDGEPLAKKRNTAEDFE